MKSSVGVNVSINSGLARQGYRQHRWRILVLPCSVAGGWRVACWLNVYTVTVSSIVVDVQFDLALIERFGLTVHGFDRPRGGGVLQNNPPQTLNSPWFGLDRW